ncbi:hypothetical protein Scep_020421 [Stephania cephalantha]|uniref:Uncharacterized protein n=1 Tax=Stephania cephalantha TaxID=152367 RepID=A0AAP0ICW3_9MAGN
MVELVCNVLSVSGASVQQRWSRFAEAVEQVCSGGSQKADMRCGARRSSVQKRQEAEASGQQQQHAACASAAAMRQTDRDAGVVQAPTEASQQTRQKNKEERPTIRALIP